MKTLYSLATVLFDKLGGDEAVLIAGLLLVGQDMHDVYLVAGGTDLVKFFFVDNAVLRA